MAFKCLECGHIFEDGEQERWEETHGLNYGPYEAFSGCPLCKGDYKETTPCKICGSEHLEEELHGCVCEECVEPYRKDWKACFKIGEKEKTSININSFLADMFGVEEIEAILYEFLEKTKEVDCSPFVDSDMEWFSERLLEEVSK
jgi:hypothetical protein